MRIEIFRICFDAAGHTLLEVIENKHDLSRDYFLCSPDVFYVLDAAPGADCHRRESEKEIWGGDFKLLVATSFFEYAFNKIRLKFLNIFALRELRFNALSI